MKKITLKYRKPDTWFQKIQQMIWEKTMVIAKKKKKKMWVLNDQPEEVSYNTEKNRKTLKS